MSSWHRFQLLCIWNKFILIRLKRVKTQTCLESIVPTYLKRLTFKSGVMLIWNHLPRRWFYPDSFQMECRKPSCQNRFGTLSTWSKLKLFFLGMKLDQFVYETGVYTYWGAMTYLWGKFLWTRVWPRLLAKAQSERVGLFLPALPLDRSAPTRVDLLCICRSELARGGSWTQPFWDGCIKTCYERMLMLACS